MTENQTRLRLPDEASLARMIQNACHGLHGHEAKHIANKILTHVVNMNNFEVDEVPFNFNDDFRPTPIDPSYGQLREALRPFAEAGRNCTIENSRVYRKNPFSYREQILSIEFDGPGLKPFVDAALLIYGSPPETPPMPASAPASSS